MGGHVAAVQYILGAQNILSASLLGIGGHLPIIGIMASGEAEIDENLARNDLIAWFQLRHLARREQVLIELGKRAGSGWNGNQHVGGDESSPPTTTEDLADMVGLSERRAWLLRLNCRIDPTNSRTPAPRMAATDPGAPCPHGKYYGIP